MKQVLISIMLLFVTTVLFGQVASYGQVPNAFNYQGVARDLSGNPIQNKNIGLRISIIQNSPSGNEVYKELHLISTNNLGLFNIQIGKGSVVSGILDAIQWGNGNYYLRIEMDDNGGSNYQLIGTSQLLSVPYALYAKSSGNSFSGYYNDLINQPLLSRIATSGDYIDLKNKPFIPDNLSQIIPDAGNRRITNVSTPENGNDAANKTYVDALKTKVFESGNNSQNPFYIGGNVDIYTSTDGNHNREVYLPIPTITNDYLYHRIGTSLLVRCRSSWDFIIKSSNTDLNQDINLTYGQSAVFYFDGDKWLNIKVSINIPTLSTLNVTSISQSTALSGGSITSNGGSPVTVRGVCWSINPNPTTQDSMAFSGSGSGSFSSTLSKLSPSTKYYVRAYAMNTQGVAYGNVVTFTTGIAQTPASLTTNSVTSVTYSSALVGGNITSDGNSSITQRGIVYSTSPNPTTDNPKITIGLGTGNFSSTLTGLKASTTYYVRAYAVNSQGTSYGNEIIFKTYYGEVVDYDGNVYPTVQIGNQIWMAENLKVTRYNDGTAISNITDNAQWAGLTSGAYCWYNNDSNNKNTYGALYNWYAVNTNKLAPIGWHVPTDTEWTTLIDYLGGAGVAGGKLKEAGTSHWLSPNAGATNESGFNAMPGGFRPSDISYGFKEIQNTSVLWHNTSYDLTNSWISVLYYNSNSLIRTPHVKNEGIAVRCILGTLNLTTITTSSISGITFESAVFGGNVTGDGSSAVTERGVVYSTSSNPTTNGSKVIIGSGTGSFSTTVNGLSPNTTYYIRAYAINSQGTSYGNEISFKTNFHETISMMRTNLVSTISPDQWHYIAITKSSGLIGKLYIDGKLVSTGSWENQIYDYSELHLGATFYTSWSNFFNGYLDEFRMSKTVRSDAEIANYYSSNSEFGVDGNTIGLWHFNESSGTTFTNSVSSTKGNLYNGVQFTSGRFGNCVLFNGINGRGNCNLDIPESNITFEFWVKFSTPQSSAIISAYGMNNSHVLLNNY